MSAELCGLFCPRTTSGATETSSTSHRNWDEALTDSGTLGYRALRCLPAERFSVGKKIRRRGLPAVASSSSGVPPKTVRQGMQDPADHRRYPRVLGPFDGTRPGMFDLRLQIYNLSLGGCFVNSVNEAPR